MDDENRRTVEGWTTDEQSDRKKLTWPLFRWTTNL